MTIQVGEAIPAVTVKKLGSAGLEDLNIAEYIKGKKVVLFAVPGAYTPTCHKDHLPGYISRAEEIKGQGVDEIICICVNDPFVAAQWSNDSGAAGKVTIIPDGNAELTKALGLDIDLSVVGLGIRSKRYVMTVENGAVQSLEIEEDPGKVTISGAESCAVKLAA